MMELEKEKLESALRGLLDAVEELLDALEVAHRDLDLLLAQRAALQRDFFPSQSPVWPNMVTRCALLNRYGRPRSEAQ